MEKIKHRHTHLLTASCAACSPIFPTCLHFSLGHLHFYWLECPLCRMIERAWSESRPVDVGGEQEKKKWASVEWDKPIAFTCLGFWWSGKICERSFYYLAHTVIWEISMRGSSSIILFRQFTHQKLKHGQHVSNFTVPVGKDHYLHYQRKWRIFTIFSLSAAQIHTASKFKSLAKHCPATDYILLLSCCFFSPWNPAICNVAKPEHPDERLLV